MLYYRPSTSEDAYELAPNLRPEDVKEVFLSSSLAPLEALIQSFEVSDECNTITHPDGSLLGMFGYATNDFFTIPWMLAGPRLHEIRRVFVPQAKDWVNTVSDKHPLLLNFVHAENKPAIGWLKSLGFSMIKLVPEYGTGKAPFYQFVRVKPNV